MIAHLKDAKLSISDDQRTYVLFDYHEIHSEENVFCFAHNGEQLWQIEPMDRLHVLNYFTSIFFNQNDLFAFCINGVEVKLDKVTGKFLSKELIK
jgi:hypothetical protein